LNDYVSFRLSEEKVQLRNLKKRVETIIDLSGSAYPFVRELNGLISVSDILMKLSRLFQGIESGVIQQDFSNAMERLLKEDVISLSEKPVDKRRKGLEIVATEIRSSVHFDITHRCNEKCIHCLVDKDNAEADTEDILDVFGQAALLGFTSFSFSGGEPSIHPDFFKILSTARDFGYYFTLFTNAINLSEEDIEDVASLFPEKVRISLYSMTPSIHDQLTQISGSFEKTMRGISLFKNAGINLYINIPVTNQNYEGYRAVAEFCDKNGFERNLDPVVQPTRDLRDKKLKLQLNYEQAKDVTGFQQSADVLVANVKDGNIVCNAGADPSIDANLDVYPCPGIRLALGNLHQSTLKELMNDHPLIAELQELDLEKLDVCQRCEYLNGCYRCHGHGYQDEGSIYACSWYDKRQAKIRQELMIERRTLTAH
jgi:radical SAM protein with 4Fe4S-binding SPASM domain